MVILSCLAKKNWNLNLRKKSSLYYWKGRFVGISGWKTQLSVINWTSFPQVQILLFLREATQNDHNRLLYKFENDQKKLVVLGVVDMCQLLLNSWETIFDFISLITKGNVFQVIYRTVRWCGTEFKKPKIISIYYLFQRWLFPPAYFEILMAWNFQKMIS